VNTKPFRNTAFAAAVAGSLVLTLTPTLFAQDAATDDEAAAELATKLPNPVASLISAPIQILRREAGRRPGVGSPLSSYVPVPEMNSKPVQPQ